MSKTNWRQVWQQSKTDPYHHIVASLMMFNGLSIPQIKQAHFEDGWVITHDGMSLPLVSYAVDALNRVDAPLSTDLLAEACQEFEPLEAGAHRRLSGAIWITDEEPKIMLEMTSSLDIPVLPLRFTFPFSIGHHLSPNEDSAIARRAADVLQTAADWLKERLDPSATPVIQRVLKLLQQGNLVFLLVSVGINGLNLIHNVLMGRLLSPADYSQLTFIITLQLLIGLIPTTMQTVTARFSARYHAQEDTSLLAELNATVNRIGWRIGIITGVILLILSPLMVSAFQLNGVMLLIPIIIFVPLLIHMGGNRGMLQGLNEYFWLSGVYLSEGVVRLGMGVILGYALLNAGRSLEGAIWGVAQSVLITWFIAWLAMSHFRTKPDSKDYTHEHAEWLKLTWVTAFVLIGQALITNSDFLLVKNFFSPDDAGRYAAISVLGRIVYFGALPLTILLVPSVARRQALGEPTRPILIMLIGGGIAVCMVLILSAALFGSQVLSLLYGEEYASAAHLLAPYALAASLYTLTNLAITYQIALGQGGETWLPIIAGSVQVVAVLIFHGTLSQVITIQILLMGALFGVVAYRVFRLDTS